MKIDFNKKGFKVFLFTGFAGWTNLLHDLSLRIKKNYPNIRFVAYCLGVHNKNFLVNQDELQYDEVFCSDELRLDYWNTDFDKHRIEELEKKYGDPFLTRTFYTDRRLVTHSHPDFYDHDPSHREILNVFQGTFNDLEKITKNCDLAIAYGGASSEAQILYKICERNDIPFLSFIHGRLGPFYNFQKTARDKYDILENKWKKMIDSNLRSSDEARLWYKNCYNNLVEKSHTSVPYIDAKDMYVDSKKINLFNISKSLKNLIKKRVVQNDTVSRKTQFKKNILFKLRQQKSKKYFSTKITKSPFVLFPLHLEPEASTLVFGGENYDAIGAIKRISYFLPSRWRILVKEHSVMRGKRPISFYKELKSIYNVDIISPDVDSMNLMKKSEALIVNTSTMGLEAAIIGLRVICLGSPFYTFIPSIYSPNSFKDIESILSTPWSEKKKSKCINEMRILVESMYDISLKDNDKILWNISPDKEKRISFVDKLYNQLFIDIKKLY